MTKDNQTPIWKYSKRKLRSMGLEDKWKAPTRVRVMYGDKRKNKYKPDGIPCRVTKANKRKLPPL